MASVCDFTNSNGIVTTQLLGEAGQAFAQGRLDQAQIGVIEQAAQTGQPIDQCVGEEPAINPRVIAGLGVLGFGAVAVALSQSDD